MRDKQRAMVALATGLMMSGTAAFAQNGNLTLLHDALHLTSAQEPVWKTYVAQTAKGDLAGSRRQAVSRLLPTLPSTRRLALIRAELEEEVADLKDMQRVLDTLYAALSPTQQRVFDAKTLPPSGSQQ